MGDVKQMCLFFYVLPKKDEKTRLAPCGRGDRLVY